METKLYQNDIVWNKIFEEYHILSELEKNNCFIISSEKIRRFREPRLMAKYDHAVKLPKIFLDHNLSILPITRGSYIIAPFKTFHSFETDTTTDDNIIHLPLPDYLQSLTYDTTITSETFALNIAAASGILSDFLETNRIENNFLIPTVSGRMGSGIFDFQIDNISSGTTQLSINNAQIEIDAAYESCDFLAIFEAKNDLSEDFIIRQLYYPYRLWHNKITKNIKTVFFVFSNGIFYLREYTFDDLLNYNSLRLTKYKKYTLENTTITTQDIQKVLREAPDIAETTVPFPQADSFERVINLCELLKSQTLLKSDITNEYAFTPRQTYYYTDAAIYLGLLEKTNVGSSSLFSLSNIGNTLLQQQYKERQLGFCRQILSHKAFRDSLTLYFNTGRLPSRDELVAIMRESKLNISSNETFKRRSATILSWIKWIVSLINE
ncbi:MAG: transcriptional regulator [Lentisphaeria bacterium]|nr:transcriptional regulator [Lentisphaeria bacterium]